MRLLLLLALALAAPFATAQPISWINEGGPPDGFVPVMHETSAGTLPAGLYFVRLTTVARTETAPMVVVRQDCGRGAARCAPTVAR